VKRFYGWIVVMCYSGLVVVQDLSDAASFAVCTGPLPSRLGQRR
jgi:hypothetical protein